jgi:5S rRNA maturation endonuclease (ribonuclease M5)/DNA-binding NarL/FixJ family response regulator
MDQTLNSNLTNSIKKSSPDNNFSYLKKKDPRKFLDAFLEFYKNKGLTIRQWHKGWQILCPFHNDTEPSLGIFRDGGCYCFGCFNELTRSNGKTYKLSDVYKAYGFWPGEPEDQELKPDLKLEDENWRVIDYKQYFYTNGEITFIRVRIDRENIQTKQRDKAFYFFQPVFKDEKEQLELVRGYVPLILYRLTEIEDKKEVFFVEGEKCVDALWDLGLPATTLPVGATVKLSKELYQALLHLKEKIVYILPDNDKAGYQFARTIKQALTNLEIQAYIITVPNLGEKSDIADYIEIETFKKKTKEEIKESILSLIQPLKKITKLELIPSTETKRIKETLPPKQEALLDGIIYPGILLFVGAPKVGKTFFLIQKGFELAEKGYKITYLALDESKETFIRKLEALGREEGHPNFFYYTRDDALEARLPLKLNEGGLQILNEVADTYTPDVIVIDIWENIRPPVQKIKDAYSQDYEAISLLRTLATKVKSIIICHHLKKSLEIDPINRALGSVGLLGAPDTIIVLERKRGETKGKLLCTSRYAQEVELAVEFTEGKWTILGDAKEVEIAEEQRRIIEAIQELGGKATPKEIAEALNKNHGTIKTHLFRMLQKGLVKKEQKGTYSVCNDVNHVNHVNHVNRVNHVNPPCRFTGFTPQVTGCKPPEPAQNLGLDDSVYTVYTVYTNDKNEIDNPEEMFFVIDKPCIKCKCQVWVVSKRILNKGFGAGTCYNCKHQELSSWNKELVISEEEAKRLSSSKDEDIPF